TVTVVQFTSIRDNRRCEQKAKYVTCSSVSSLPPDILLDHRQFDLRLLDDSHRALHAEDGVSGEAALHLRYLKAALPLHDRVPATVARRSLSARVHRGRAG